MKKHKIMKACLFLSVFALCSCTEMKYDDLENGIRYTKDKGEDSFVIAKYLDDLPENLLIRGTINNCPVSGFDPGSFDSNNHDTTKVKHMTFEASKKFEATFNFKNLIDITMPDSGNFNITVKSENLKELKLNGASVTCSLQSSRTIDAAIEGGYLSNLTPFGVMKIKKNSVVETVNSSNSSYKNNYDFSNEIAVFEDGYNFSDETYCRNTFEYKKYDFFGNLKEEEYRYLPFANIIYIPKSVTYISDRFFGNETPKKEIELHYEGTEEEWKNVRISNDNNDNYSKVKMYYNSTYSE